MKNLFAFLFVIVSLSATLQSMEDAEQKSINKKRKHSAAESIAGEQAVRFKKMRETVGWDSLPPESKQHILYFVATGGNPTDALKNLKRAALANKDCYDLIEDQPFLKSLPAIWLSQNPQDATNIFIAASGAHQIEFFDAFRQAGIDIDQVMETDSALQAAVENGHDDFVKMLLDNGAEVSYRNLISVSGRQDISKMLLATGCIDLQPPLPAQKKSSLLYDIVNGRLERVKALLKKGANVNSCDQHGVTGLMYACINGDAELVQLLINSGADVNSISTHGTTSLLYAVNSNSLEIVKLLVVNKAHLEGIVYFSVHTPLMFAAYKGYQEIVKLLIESNANVNLQDNTGETALTIAAEAGHTEVVKLLIENNANIDHQNNDGRTALMWASEKGFTEIAQLLIDNGAHVNAQNNYNDTALIYACQRGLPEMIQFEIVQLLIRGGANINAQDEYGYTPIMTAALCGSKRVVELLLEYKADLNLKNSENKTALDVAIKHGHEEIVSILQNFKQDNMQN